VGLEIGREVLTSIKDDRGGVRRSIEKKGIWGLRRWGGKILSRQKKRLCQRVNKQGRGGRGGKERCVGLPREITKKGEGRRAGDFWIISFQKVGERRLIGGKKRRGL